jgi:DNA-binding response OmpR family regulator
MSEGQKKHKLAYIDDNQNNLEYIGLILENDFEVEIFNDPLKFLEQFPQTSYKAILVDIHMPTIDGFSLYEKIIENTNYNGCPLIFISSDDTNENRIRSFTLGAVDFLNRMMTPVEMLSRVRSKIAFFDKHRSVIEFGSLRLNLTLLKTYLGDEELKLTFIEFKLLCHFLKTYPAASSKEELIDKIWSNGLVLDATIYTHIFNLNAKLVNWDHEVITERMKGSLLVKKEAKKK